MKPENTRFGTMALVSTACWKCFGTGGIRKRNMIGAITYDTCKHCRGHGRVLVMEKSPEHRIGEQVKSGMGWPGIRKHNNDRGWNRR